MNSHPRRRGRYRKVKSRITKIMVRNCVFLLLYFLFKLILKFNLRDISNSIVHANQNFPDKSSNKRIKKESIKKKNRSTNKGEEIHFEATIWPCNISSSYMVSANLDGLK